MGKGGTIKRYHDIRGTYRDSQGRIKIGGMFIKVCWMDEWLRYMVVIVVCGV